MCLPHHCYRLQWLHYDHYQCQHLRWLPHQCPYVKSIQAGTTTTTDTEHSARKLMPHATTVGPFTRSLWNTTTFDQLQDLFRSIAYSFCHISWDAALVFFICFPSVIHSIERRLNSTQATTLLYTGQPESVLCKQFAQMLQLLVANHSFGAAVDFPVFCAHSCIPSWKIMLLCSHEISWEPYLESGYESGNSSMSRPFKCSNNSWHIHHDSCWLMVKRCDTSTWMFFFSVDFPATTRIWPSA